MHRRTVLLRPNDERGQVVVLLAVTLTVLLGSSALVIDVGRAYITKRHLQASADAAALAGAQALPDAAAAVAVAQSYSGATGDRNDASNLPAVSVTATTKCLSTTRACNPVNAIVVQESTSSPTTFARLFGINSFTIGAKATALMSSGTPRPAHVMIIFDRTNSMNDPCSEGGTKVTCVRNGIMAFLQGMDPTYDKVGLIAFPPGNGGNPCTFPPKSTDGPTTDYDKYPNGYVLVPLSNDYKTSPTSPLNSKSALVSTVNCIKAQGTTATAPAIDKAQATLAANHVAGTQDVIIFLTDGEANYGPCLNPDGKGVCSNNTSLYRSEPCHQAVSSARAAASTGTWVYGIAYDTQNVQCWGWRATGTGTDGKSCNKTDGYQFRCAEGPSITANATVQGIASDPTKFFDQPNPGDLTTVFKTIASDLAGPRLVDDNYTG